MVKRIKTIRRQQILQKRSPSLKEDPKVSRAFGDAASGMFDQMGKTIETYGKFKASADSDAKNIQARTYEEVAKGQAISIRNKMRTEGTAGKDYQEEFTKRYNKVMASFNGSKDYNLLSDQHKFQLGLKVSNNNMPNVISDGAKIHNETVKNHINDETALIKQNAYQNPENYSKYVIDGGTLLLKSSLEGKLSNDPISVKRNIRWVDGAIKSSAAQGYLRKLQAGKNDDGSDFRRKTEIVVTAHAQDGSFVKVLSTPEKEINKLIKQLPKTEQDAIRKDMRDAESFALNHNYNTYDKNRRIKMQKLKDESSKKMLAMFMKAEEHFKKGNFAAGNVQIQKATELASSEKMTVQDLFNMRNKTSKVKKGQVDYMMYAMISTDPTEVSLEAAENYLQKAVSSGSINVEHANPWFARIMNLKNNKGGASKARQMARLYDKKLSLFSKYDSNLSFAQQMQTNFFKNKEEFLHKGRRAHVELLHAIIQADGDLVKMEESYNNIVKRHYSDNNSRLGQMLLGTKNIILNTPANITKAEEHIHQRVKSKLYTTMPERQRTLDDIKLIQESKKIQHQAQIMKDIGQPESNAFKTMMKELDNPVVFPYYRED